MLDSKNLRKILGSKMNQREGGENGTIRIVEGRIML
jgi:hypothetical protein